MNRLDTAQIEMPVLDTRLVQGLIWGTIALACLAVIAAVVQGVSVAHNPTDRFYATLAALPIGLAVVDLWVVVVAWLRRNAPTPLRIPYKTPLILISAHVAIAAGLNSIADFDTLYELTWEDSRTGQYQVRWGVASGILAAALLAVLLTVFELRLVRWVLISEVTSAASAARGSKGSESSETEDAPLGSEHVYEAQVLLNNLEYDVRPISGEMHEAMKDSLGKFQKEVGLEMTGDLTVKTMIELRNRWRDHEAGGSQVKAVSEHAVRRTRSKIARLFRRSG